MPIKILGIAPYEGLRELLISETRDRDGVQMTVILGDISDGEDLIQRVQAVYRQYDVIISRGGTGRAIRACVDIPVIEISTGSGDIMRVVHLLRGYEGKSAFVGYGYTESTTRGICEIMGMNIESYTVKTQTELEECLRTLQSQQYHLAIGGVATVKQAQAIGMNAILIPSGIESVRATIEEALRLCRATREASFKSTLLDMALAGGEQALSVWDGEGRQAAAFGTERYAFTPAQAEKYLKMARTHKRFTAVSQGSAPHFMVSGNTFELDGKSYTSLSIKPLSLPAETADAWLTIKNPNEFSGSAFNVLHSQVPQMQEMLSRAQGYAQSGAPVLVYGEGGTGKSALVYNVHAMSPSSNCALICIDAALGSKKRWTALLESEDSPLYERGYACFIKNAQEIPEQFAKRLAELLQGGLFRYMSSLYFTWETGCLEACIQQPLYRYIVYEMHGLTLGVPPLRKRRKDIPDFCRILIGEANTVYDKQVFEIEDAALDLLMEFPWPQNFDQLRSLIKQAVVLSEGYRISEATVRTLLDETSADLSGAQHGTLHLDRTLAEITDEVIDMVLREENYNSTRAAKRLGISRSSLWRKSRLHNTACGE